ncbi:unnamed protein product [Urochloa humidicola]
MELMPDPEVGAVVVAYQMNVVLPMVLDLVWVQALRPGLKECLLVLVDILVLAVLEAAAVVDKLAVVMAPIVMGPVVVLVLVQAIQTYTQEDHLGADQVL